MTVLTVSDELANEIQLTERAKYSGKYVAVHNQQLVDSDSDNAAI